MQKLSFYLTLVAALAPALASAQTYTVSQGGGADYTSISSAIAALTPDPDTNTPNIVRVLDNGVYDESITITVPVTIEATGAEKATIAVQSNSQGLNSNGGVIVNLDYPTYTTGTVALRNLNIIPSLSTSGALLSTAIEQKNANVFLMLDKVIVCPNDGTNKPLVKTAVDNRISEVNYGGGTNALYNPAIIQFGDDGLIAGRVGAEYSEGDGVEVLIRDSVITHFRGDLANPKTSTAPDCVVFGGGSGWPVPYFRRITVEGSGGVSYGRIGLYLFGDVQIHGNPLDRLHIRGHSLAGIYLDHPTQSTTSKDISNVIIDGVSQYGIYDNGRGDVRYSLRDSILYYFGRGVLFTKKQTTAVGGDNIFERCTMVDGRKGGYHSYRWEQGNTMNIVIRNCIVGGKYDFTTSTQSANNVLWFSTGAGATCHISSSAIITEGPFALRPSQPYASEPTTSESLIHKDPRFVTSGTLLIPDGIAYYDPAAQPGTYDPRSVDFLNVTNPAYAEAADLDPTDGVTSAPLGGGAKYTGPAAAVQDWGLYSVGTPAYEHSLEKIVQMHDRRMHKP